MKELSRSTCDIGDADGQLNTVSFVQLTKCDVSIADISDADSKRRALVRRSASAYATACKTSRAKDCVRLGKDALVKQ